MISPEHYRRRQKAVVIVGLMLFQFVLIFMQIWLFVTLLEHSLAGHTDMAIPSAIASMVVLGINIWMLRGITLLSRAS